jgi:hypothetical protein
LKTGLALVNSAPTIGYLLTVVFLGLTLFMIHLIKKLNVKKVGHENLIEGLMEDSMSNINSVIFIFQFCDFVGKGRRKS